MLYRRTRKIFQSRLPAYSWKIVPYFIILCPRVFCTTRPFVGPRKHSFIIHGAPTTILRIFIFIFYFSFSIFSELRHLFTGRLHRHFFRSRVSPPTAITCITLVVLKYHGPDFFKRFLSTPLKTVNLSVFNYCLLYYIRVSNQLLSMVFLFLIFIPFFFSFYF